MEALKSFNKSIGSIFNTKPEAELSDFIRVWYNLYNSDVPFNLNKVVKDSIALYKNIDTNSYESKFSAFNKEQNDEATKRGRENSKKLLNFYVKYLENLDVNMKNIKENVVPDEFKKAFGRKFKIGISGYFKPKAPKKPEPKKEAPKKK